MACCTIFEPPTKTVLSPATRLACSTALPTPSVTNLKGESSLTHSCGGLWGDDEGRAHQMAVCRPMR